MMGAERSGPDLRGAAAAEAFIVVSREGAGRRTIAGFAADCRGEARSGLGGGLPCAFAIRYALLYRKLYTLLTYSAPIPRASQTRRTLTLTDPRRQYMPKHPAP